MTVAGHGHDRPRLPQGIDDSQLVLGVDACVDRHLSNRGCARLVRELLEFRPGDGATVFGDAKLPGDDGGCPGVIARDHERTNSGESRPRNRVPGFGPRRVDHPNQPGEHQVPFDAFVGMISMRRERIAR